MIMCSPLLPYPTTSWFSHNIGSSSIYVTQDSLVETMKWYKNDERMSSTWSTGWCGEHTGQTILRSVIVRQYFNMPYSNSLVDFLRGIFYFLSNNIISSTLLLRFILSGKIEKHASITHDATWLLLPPLDSISPNTPNYGRI